MRIKLDQNNDGVINAADLAAGLNEVFDTDPRGRLEQHVLVPFGKAFMFGSGTWLITFALLRYASRYFSTFNSWPDRMPIDTSLTAGLFALGLWLCVEMIVSTGKPLTKAKEAAYDEGYTDAETKYKAAVSQLEHALVAAQHERGGGGNTSLTATEEIFLSRGQTFLSLLYEAHPQTAKETFCKTYANVSQPMWGKIRDRMVSLGIIDNARNTIVSDRAEAQELWGRHVEKVHNMRKTGGTPVL